MQKFFICFLGFLLLGMPLSQAQKKVPEVDRIPLFPTCKPKTMEKDLKCFQKKINKHIAASFIYPKEALENNIEGVVQIMMTITEEGRITDVRTRGPHPLLEAEAVRIMTLLPKFSPALKDGLPVAIPYSIPITFRLNSSLTKSRSGPPEDPFEDFYETQPSRPYKN